MWSRGQRPWRGMKVSVAAVTGGADDVRGQPGQTCASSATVRGLSVSLRLEVPGGL